MRLAGLILAWALVWVAGAGSGAWMMDRRTPEPEPINVRILDDLREFAKLKWEEAPQPQLSKSMAVVDSTGALIGGPVVILAVRKLTLAHVSWFSQVYVDTAQVTSEYKNLLEDPIMMSESPGTDSALARVPLYMADALWEFLVDYQ